MWSLRALSLALLTFIAVPAHAAVDPLCGTTITSDLTLTADVDCVSHVGPAIAIGADNVKIDGNGFRIIAPDASSAIYALNRNGVTIENVDVSGWCKGIGILVDGGTGAIIRDVIADSREVGVHVIRATSPTVQNLSTDGAGTGLHLESITTAPTLSNLQLTNAHYGLRVRLTTASFTLGAAQIGSLAGSLSGIWLDNVSNITVTGLTLTTNPLHAILANYTTNTNLTFTDLDVSGFGGGDLVGGYGILLQGTGHVLDDITANDRQYGVHLSSVTNLSATNITARRAGVGAFYLGSTTLGVANTLTLANLVLTDSTRALFISNLDGNPASPFQITPSVLASAAGSRVGIQIEGGSSYLDLRNLTLSNWGWGVHSTNNSNLRFEDLDLSTNGPRNVNENRGLEVSGSNIYVADVIANGRRIGLYAHDLTNFTVDTFSSNQAGTAFRLDNMTLAPTNTLSLTNIRGTNSDIALQVFNLDGQLASPFVIDATLLSDTTGSGTGIDLNSNSSNLVVRGASAAARWALPNAVYGILMTGASNTNIRLEHLDVSGPGHGQGIWARGTDVTLFDIVANQRSIGVQTLQTSNLRIENLSVAYAHDSALQLGSITGTNPTLVNMALTNSKVALTFSGFNPTTTFVLDPAAIASVADSDTGVSISSTTTNLKLDGLTLPNAKNGVLVGTGSSTNVVLEDLVLDGAGLGYGINASNSPNIVVRRVRADRRFRGFYAQNTSNLVVEDLTARHCAIAFDFAQLASGGTPPTLSGLMLTRNALAFQISNTVPAMTIGPDTPGAALAYLTTTGSTTSLAIWAANAVTLRNLRLDGLSTGLSAYGNNANLILDGINASGVGIGTGISLTSPVATLTNAVADYRQDGINVSATATTTVTNARARNCDVGFRLGAASTSAAGPALNGIDVQGSNIGMWLTWNGLPWTMNQVPVALNATGTNIGLFARDASNVTFDGLVLPGRSHGFNATIVVSNLTLRNMNVSGAGLGIGVELAGAGHAVQNVTADDRVTGFNFSGTANLTLTNLTSRHANTGLTLASPTGTLSMSGLTLEDAAPAFLLSGYTGTLALGLAHFTSLAGAYPAITIQTSPSTTVNAGALGLTGPTLGSWHPSLPSSDPLCGTTHATNVTLSADLDCSGTTGTALTMTGTAVLDGDGFKIIAPHASTVVQAEDDSSVIDLDVSGTRSTGTGVRITGSGSVSNVIANRRSTGIAISAAGGAAVSGSTARGASLHGLRIENLIGPLELTNLTLEGNVEGVSIIGSGAGFDPGGGDLTLDAASFTTLAGNLTSIRIGADDVIIAGLSLDGATYGIQGTGANLLVTNVDASANNGGGTGFSLNGTNVSIVDCVASRRSLGLGVATLGGLVVDGFTSTGSAGGMEISGSDLTLSPATVLDDIDLRENVGGFRVSSSNGPFTIDGGSFVLPLDGRRDNLTDISTVVGARDITFTNLYLGGHTFGFSIGSGPNIDLVGVTAISDAEGGVGIITPQTTTADIDITSATLSGFAYGLQNGFATDTTLTNITVDGATVIGLNLPMTGSAFQASGLVARNCATGLYTDNVNNTAFTFAGTGTPAPGLALITTFSGNETDLWYRNTSNITTRDLAFSGSVNGIQTSSVGSLVVRDVTYLGRAPTGTGFNLSGTNALVERLTATQANLGLQVNNTTGLTLDRATVTRGATCGIQIANSSSTLAAPVVLSNLSISNSGASGSNCAGLDLTNVNASANPLTINPAVLTTMADNPTGVRIAGSRFITVNGLTLSSASYGVLADSSTNQSLTLSNLNLSSTRPSGVGLRMNGAGLTVSQVIANHRNSGIEVDNGASNVSIAGFTANNTTLGMAWSAVVPPVVLTGITAKDSGTALRFANVAGPWTLSPTTLVTHDFSGSYESLVFEGTANGVTVEGFRLPGLTRGLLLNTSTSNFVVGDLDASGVTAWAGSMGLFIAGSGHSITDVVANMRHDGLVVRPGASNIAIDGLEVNGAGSIALHVFTASPTVTLSDLTLTNSNIGVQLDTLVGTSGSPYILDGDAIGTSSFGGNLTTINLRTTRYVAVRNLDLPGLQSGLTLYLNVLASDLSNLDASRGSVANALYCSPPGVGSAGLSIGGINTTVSDLTVLGRTTGVTLTNSHNTTVDGGLIAANERGIQVYGNSVLIDTTVVADITNTATRFRIANTGNLILGQSLRVDVGGGPEDRLLTATSGNFITLDSALSAIPTAGTPVRSSETGLPRVTVTDTDICANRLFGTDAGAITTTATDNYWRTAAGPVHSSNPGGTGDVVNATAIDVGSYELAPFDVVNPYCNAEPIPDAGPDTHVCAGDTVTLDGSGSTDPDNEPLTYAWSQTAGQGVPLGTPNAVTATFTAPSPTTAPVEALTFLLTVDDNDAMRSDAVTLTTHTRNTAPSAAAGDDQHVSEGDPVSLSGAGSSDPEGESLTYAWTWVSGPSVTLTGANTATPSFTAPAIGVDGGPYSETVVLRLTVTDAVPEDYCGEALTHFDDVEIEIENINNDPIADAGADQIVNESTVVTLDGSASDDPDNDVLTYVWTQTDGTPVTLSDDSVVGPTFTAPNLLSGSDVLTFELWVGDGHEGAGHTDTVQITVNATCTIIGPDTNCDNVDDDCNGVADDAYIEDESCFLPGACAVGNEASSCEEGGVETICQTGSPTGVSETECNGIDDDCNDQIDEAWLPSEDCFLPGACSAGNVASTCVGSTFTECQTGSPTGVSETECNGIDDDCNDQIDEAWLPSEDCFLPGACSAGNVASTCVGSTFTECQTGSPTGVSETECNGIDDDCNDQIDEAWLPSEDCFLPGACSAGNVASTCVGSTFTECQTGSPTGVSETECNGIDDDCNDQIDEAWLPSEDCFLPGACSAGNVASTCVGSTFTECQTGSPTGVSETECNGIDDDCNDQIDEAWLPSEDCFLPGACSAGNVASTCVGSTFTECQTGSPTGIPESECNGVDDDCNDQIDEAWLPSEDCFLPGACSAGNVASTCVGSTFTECQTGSPTGVSETECNGIDDDCNDQIDEAWLPSEDCFLPGACSAGNVASTCVGSTFTECQTGSPTGIPESECNGVDDDCNDQIDEAWLPSEDCFLPGACSAGNVASTCVGSTFTECQTGSPTGIPESECNGVDDDCNDQIDEAWLPSEDCFLPGACSAGNVASTCVGSTFTECQTGSPTGIPESECNGIDDDCNDQIDEAWLPSEDCFLPGACSAGNVASTCVGSTFTECQTGSPTGIPESECNGIDDDCNDQIDEAWLPSEDCFLPGACSAGNVASTCVGSTFTECQTGTGIEETCDGTDEDCDGTADNGVEPATESCIMIGGCEGLVTSTCQGGDMVPEGECTLAEAILDGCDGIDNDCDTEIDENFVPETITCGEDACAVGQGETTCSATGVPGDTCDALWTDIPDTTCSDGTSGLNVTYIIVNDANGNPAGSIRCAQDLDAPGTPVVCDTRPGTTELVVYNELLCEGVAP